MNTRHIPLVALLALSAALLPACGRPSGGPVGPVLGHVDAERALIWYRPDVPGTYLLALRPAETDGDGRTLTATSDPARDHALVWTAADLAPQTTYTFSVRDEEESVLAEGRVRTAPAPGTAARVRLTVGSCTGPTDDAVWSRMVEAGADAIVLLGDTPYIDSTHLPTMLARHRAFLERPAVAAALRQVPVWSTWDDHDYGRDRGDGAMPGKDAARQAYLAYRAQARFGEDGQGIYTRVRYGPVEVFLLDTRWFAGLEAVPGDASARSCLGQRQAAWLRDALRASDAPFKLVASGMVWHDKGGGSSDDWATYAAERDALFAFLGDAEIPGCVLLGGDVHACQHAVFEDTGAGYPLHELVISPMHERAWRGGDRRHPARRWGTVQRHVFLLLDVDATVEDPRLTATWMRANGEALHRIEIRSADLEPGDPPR